MFGFKERILKDDTPQPASPTYKHLEPGIERSDERVKLAASIKAEYEKIVTDLRTNQAEMDGLLEKVVTGLDKQQMSRLNDVAIGNPLRIAEEESRRLSELMRRLNELS